MYYSCGIAFDGAGLWNFANNFASNVAIFGNYNSSLSHIDNNKHIFVLNQVKDRIMIFMTLLVQ